jgi:hypothetical protein
MRSGRPVAPRPLIRELETKARALAGLKGYVTNLRACPDGTATTGILTLDDSLPVR